MRQKLSEKLWKKIKAGTYFLLLNLVKKKFPNLCQLKRFSNTHTLF